MVAGFPGGSAGKESTHNAGDLGSVPGLGRSPGEGNGPPLPPVFWPGESQGLYSPSGLKESDATERLALPRWGGSGPQDLLVRQWPPCGERGALRCWGCADRGGGAEAWTRGSALADWAPCGIQRSRASAPASGPVPSQAHLRQTASLLPDTLSELEGRGAESGPGQGQRVPDGTASSTQSRGSELADFTGSRPVSDWSCGWANGPL